ncbi:ferric reductase-like transmembrane domain-containing protein [Prauserella cavernicola]|uniref:Ferric reductase-like transmembrane domain-containing protein n=1 Tax=Prauserella cavernicola TaxID=2800127 RepID=A0A934QM12_9PSEU|nr:ferric reductase-like transmembrane domain-containing protein [Prauserella cavernicola]MBK1782706.1 ferric reductase-like transmembrane domain-containing protein [Prauserella cavernicola]
MPARSRTGLDRAALRADLRAALPDATAALALTGAIFLFLYVRVRAATSDTLAVMPFLADANEYWMYWLCQAFGWSALLWAWLTTMLGLLRSGPGPRRLPVSAARLERWHRSTSLTTIALMFAHAAFFFAEQVRSNEDGLGPVGRVWRAFVDSFVPGGYASGTGQVAILLGLIALYLAIPLGLLYYFRAGTGARMWRALHRFVLVVYVLSAWHTLLYGTNVWFDGWPRTTLWLLQLPVALVLLARLLEPARRAEKSSGASPRTRVLRGVAITATLAVIAAIVAVVVTGRDGGRTPDVPSAPMSVTADMVWVGLVVFAVAVAVTVLVVRTSAARTPERARRDRSTTTG